MRSTCFWAAAWLRVTICEVAGAAAEAVRFLLPLGCVCLAAPAMMPEARLSVVDCLPVVICWPVVTLLLARGDSLLAAKAALWTVAEGSPGTALLSDKAAGEPKSCDTVWTEAASACSASVDRVTLDDADSLAVVSMAGVKPAAAVRSPAAVQVVGAAVVGAAVVWRAAVVGAAGVGAAVVGATGAGAAGMGAAVVGRAAVVWLAGLDAAWMGTAALGTPSVAATSGTPTCTPEKGTAIT